MSGRVQSRPKKPLDSVQGDTKLVVQLKNNQNKYSIYMF